MKNPQENLATLNIWSRNVTTSTREPTTRAWISADIWRQDGAICSKNRKIVPYHGSARIPRLTVSVPDYGSWRGLMYRSIPKPPMPPPGKPPGIWLFWKFLVKFPAMLPVRRSNAPPVRASKRVKSPTLQACEANCGNKFRKIFSHYEFLV